MSPRPPSAKFSVGWRFGAERDARAEAATRATKRETERKKDEETPKKPSNR